MVFFLMTGQAGYIHADKQPKMDVHFIDVGQGDSMLIQTPSGKNILIDGGPPDAGNKVVSFLERHDVDEIDLLVATHPDIDHIGGFPRILKSVEVEQLLDSGKMYTTKTYARYISQILFYKVPVTIAEENELVNVDPHVKIRVLNAHSGTEDNNESSIVLQVSFKKIDFLLMADVREKQEEQLIKKYNLDSEIIKIAHHGSSTSTSIDFLKEVSPQLAVISYGKENDFGHPVNRVIDNLDKVKADIYSTAVYGDITIRSDGNSYMVLTEKTPISIFEAG
ncbi:ComEC/Rec2 family competence protein [Virgibacillus siamensis]|uniref:ComEC/Rec2 family competence protein n=1 Tax=Virgibacillus siamensis TaxID=480071 RepID=UPI00158EE8EA|nr:ComEC/Rec2 family competence protein [Virgibacillus siamensis]